MILPQARKLRQSDGAEDDGPATRGRRIAIIGAGFSGSLLAVQLLRRSRPGDRFYLVERSAAFGRGLAYATGNPQHLLNVRAGNMSAFSDQPEHFLRWLVARQPAELADAGGTDRFTFVSRRLYGSYIQDLLADQLWGAGATHRLFLVTDEAVDIDRQGESLWLEVDGGRKFEVDAAVLAVGNLHPEESISGYAVNPWDPEALAGLDPNAAVLLIGTGLTMVDVVLSLLGRGHRGEIRAVSRRGLLPRVHAPVAARPSFLAAESAPRTVLALLRALRREIARAALEGADWRVVIDSLRPATQELWLRLPLVEKQRFLRHLRPWWDVHRHRMAPAVAARIRHAQGRGQLRLQRGRIARMLPERGHIAVELSSVGAKVSETFHAQRVINCTGPFCDMTRVSHRLIRRLLHDGQARADALCLGLDVTREGAVIRGDGQVSRALFAIGPITRGVFWESVAVPDIRILCERLADHLLGALTDRAPSATHQVYERIA
jgi:uncharacterized NAD(P)/FAD-binding protein YdhS